MNPGDIINERYCLNSFIGAGIFGEVWKVHDNILDLNVALKIFTSSDPSSIIKLQDEYKKSFQLSHENILSPKYFDVYRGFPYIIYSLCESGSLRTHIPCNDEKTIWKIIHDISSGLCELNKNSIIHNNLKPENVFEIASDTYAISDISLSNSTRATMSKESMDRYTSAIAYRAPEAKIGKELSSKCDIWSLGAIVYELITGKLPSDIADDIDASLSKSSKYISNQLQSTIISCLKHDKESRPTAGELRNISEEILTDRKSNKKGKHKDVEESIKNDGTIAEGIKGNKKTLPPASRNLIVTIYEWLLILSTVLFGIIAYGIGANNLSVTNSGVAISDYDWYTLYVDEYFIVGFVCTIKLLGEIMLLSKIRVGFAISSAALFCALYALLKIGNESDPSIFIMTCIITLLYIVILWLMLLIRKNGLSQWKTMYRHITDSNRKWITWYIVVSVVLFVVCEFLTLVN